MLIHHFVTVIDNSLSFTDRVPPDEETLASKACGNTYQIQKRVSKLSKATENQTNRQISSLSPPTLRSTPPKAKSFSNKPPKCVAEKRTVVTGALQND